MSQTLHSVYGRSGVGVNEPCVCRDDGDFVGVKTGTVFPEKTHYGRPRLIARVSNVANPRDTGMWHLDEPVGTDRRAKFLGCQIAVEAAHWMGETRVYFSPDVGDYFADSELKIEWDD